MTASRGRIRIGFGNKAGVDITALYLPGFIYRSGSIITLRHLLLSNCFLIELNVIDLPFRDLYPGDQCCLFYKANASLLKVHLILDDTSN